jgi:hypothetical protein
VGDPRSAAGERCAACGFDPAAYTAQDRVGTLRSFEGRWRWMLEGIDEDLLAAAGPAGWSVRDHQAAARAAVGGGVAVGGGGATVPVVHAGTHHLAAAGRLLHDLGAPPASGSGVVSRINRSGGGAPKMAIPDAVVGERGIEGDRQATRRHHGRPWQALSLWSSEVIGALAAEGHPIGPGCAGENLTVGGLDWAALRPGVRLQVGTVLAEITSWADPCSQLTPWFLGGRFARIQHDRHPWWSRAYAGVVRGGVIRTGDAVLIEPEGAGGGRRLAVPGPGYASAAGMGSSMPDQRAARL